MLQHTLSIIKPDAVVRKITGNINRIIEETGLNIVEQKKLHLTPELARSFYFEHRNRPFLTENWGI